MLLERTFNSSFQQCPGCGFKSTVRIYGGYGWSGFSFDYILGTFNAWNTDLLIGFKFQGKDGYSNSFSKTLAEFGLPGIGVSGFLSVNPFVQLNTDLDFHISGGTITAENIGVGYHQHNDFWLRFDFLHSTVSVENFFSDSPYLLDPIIQYMPTDVHFSAGIGPAFGMELDALSFSGKAAIGLDTPKITLDVAGEFARGFLLS